MPDAKQPFSERHGFRPREVEIRIWDDFPADLRDVVVDIAYESGLDPHAARSVACKALRKRKNPDNWSAYPNVDGEVRELLANAEPSNVYDLIEVFHQYLTGNEGEDYRPKHFEREVNKLFKNEGVGWQLVGGELQIREPEALQQVVGKTAEPKGGKPVTAAEEMPLLRPKSKWDLFISYASEDRAEVAEPLAKLLSHCGLKVWYDQNELRLGDGLRRKIDEGLIQCRYGVVILSPSFFLKHYPNRELDGLAQREVDGQTVILPIWYKVTDAKVRAYSPPLADRIAGRWEDGLNAVLVRILKVVRPEPGIEIKVARELKKELLIQDLVGTSDFKTTHDTLQQLVAFESYTAEQLNDIVLAAITNRQIYLIRSDSDINRNLRHIIKGNEERIEPENLAKFARYFLRE